MAPFERGLPRDLKSGVVVRATAKRIRSPAGSAGLPGLKGRSPLFCELPGQAIVSGCKGNQSVAVAFGVPAFVIPCSKVTWSCREEPVTIRTVSDLSIIITGAARGIGATTAALLAANGAKVVLADILDEEGQALARQLGKAVTYCHLDVTAEQGWQATVEHGLRSFGKVNALFNNAGVLSVGNVATCSPDDFRRVLDINLYGVFLGIHSVIPAIKAAGGGVIVNNSSTAGLQGYGNLAAYVSSKWAVRGLTKAAALDLAADGIRVLSLHPGPIRTPMTAGFTDATVSAQPIARFGEPEEVARMVQFMLTEASFSTGSEFVVDGGAVTGQVLPLN